MAFCMFTRPGTPKYREDHRITCFSTPLSSQSVNQWIWRFWSSSNKNITSLAPPKTVGFSHGFPQKFHGFSYVFSKPSLGWHRAERAHLERSEGSGSPPRVAWQCRDPHGAPFFFCRNGGFPLISIDVIMGGFHDFALYPLISILMFALYPLPPGKFNS